MVTAGEVDMLYLEEMYKENPEKFIRFLNDAESELDISFNESRARTYLAKLLHNGGYSEKDIAKALGTSPSDIRSRLNSSVAKSTMNAFRMLSVGTVLRMTKEFPYSLKITKLKVRRLLAMDLLRAGWCNKCVAAVTGLSLRTIQRYKRKLDE